MLTETSTPVDVVRREDLAGTGQIQLQNAISIVVPSFSVSKPSTAGALDFTSSPTLRGLGPGDTLLLVNGKRRHSMPALNLNTTVGTTLADFFDRSLGIGYSGGTATLLGLLLASLWLWRRTLGSVSVHSVSSPKAEVFYWVTIMFSQTLGTALGDWTADTAGLGYTGGAMIFSALLAVVALAYFRTRISRTALFWAAFVVTRPLGAVVGDYLDKPIAAGGLALSRFSASAALLAFIAFTLLAFKHRASAKAH